MQKNWKVCTTNGDPNHNIVMKMCPATCAMARGDACPKAAPVLSAASKVKIIAAVKKADAKKLAKKVTPKKVKAVKKVVKKVVAKKVPAVKKLVKMISAKKVKAVLKKHALPLMPLSMRPRKSWWRIKLLLLMPRPRATTKRRSLTLTRIRSTPLRTNGMLPKRL